jgi:hypothetical protein
MYLTRKKFICWRLKVGERKKHPEECFEKLSSFLSFLSFWQKDDKYKKECVLEILFIHSVMKFIK